MSHQLRRDDPVYYKTALKGLISEAIENGVKVSGNRNTYTGNAVISFEADTGEKACIEVEWIES